MKESDPRMPHATDDERMAARELFRLLRTSPVPDSDLIDNLVLYIRPQVISLWLAIAELYQKVLDIHGIVLDLGTRYGRNMALFASLRAVYEPYNHFRTIVGFDRFIGLPMPTAQDGSDTLDKEGDYATPPAYAEYLQTVLNVHERLAPLSHIRRTEIVCGDIEETLSAYFATRPEVTVALAYFDMDLYQPTAVALDEILPRCVRGSVLVFDEPGHPRFPGEMAAIRERLSLRDFSLRRSPLRAQPAYVIL